MKAIFKAFFCCIGKWQNQEEDQVVVIAVKQLVVQAVELEEPEERVVRVVEDVVESVAQVQFVELFAKQDAQATCHLLSEAFVERDADVQVEAVQEEEMSAIQPVIACIAIL